MRLIVTLFTALALLTPLAMATGEPAQGFRIMDQVEVSQHLAAMKRLQGTEREEYRNRVYAELRERARQQGYDMPTTPPWQQQASHGNTFRPAMQEEQASTAPIATEATSASQPQAEPVTTAEAPDMPKLIAQQKQVLKEAVQQQIQEQAEQKTATPETPKTAAPETPKTAAPETPKTAAPETPKTAAPETPADVQTAAPPAADSYQQQMRKRFDDFMARRGSGQQPGNPPQQPPMPVYPRPMQPQAPVAPPGPPAYPQPAYPQPAYPQPGYPGYPPYGYPPRAPGWY